ncbi:MAG: YjbQ family protein [Verrucomicrobiae bacterium]|nr:YjbQ family protein [Verrucomicrobiae bacterium]
MVNAMHITASVFINDDESGLHHDYETWLETLAPHAPTTRYQHNRTGEDNADAHLKRQIMGREVVVAITGGKLDFGPWEQIFYGRFQHPDWVVQGSHPPASPIMADARHLGGDGRIPRPSHENPREAKGLVAP